MKIGALGGIVGIVIPILAATYGSIQLRYKFTKYYKGECKRNYRINHESTESLAIT